MQDRYTGDIGDFGKYGLLRSLTAGTAEHPPLRLAVVWYRAVPETNNDGRHVSYLSSPTLARRYRERDPALFDLLQRLVRSGARSVRTVREWGLLPPATTFVEEFVGQGGLRDDWCARAVASTSNAQLVFLDPDNGLEVATVSRRRSAAPKYTYYSELTPYLARGQSLVVYHHLGQRTRTADVEISARLAELSTLSEAEPFAVRFRGGTARAYFVIPEPANRGRLLDRTREFLASGWGSKGLFEDHVYE